MRRIQLSGILARFSDQPVSSTPVSGDSRAMSSPFSCQKVFTTGQSFSGGASTTSQRVSPSRRTCMPSGVGRTSFAPARGCCARSAW